MGVKTIYLFHHIIDRYRKTTETYFKDNQNISNEAFDTTININQYFEIIDDYSQYAYEGKQPYKPYHIINNA